MKQVVKMQREILGGTVSQRSDNDYFSATELVNLANKYRFKEEMPMFNLAAFLSQQGTKEFMDELEQVVGGKVVIKGRGRNSNTWVHPSIFIDIALTISPKLKVKVYEWVKDNLLALRHASSDSYRAMCDALYNNESEKDQFQKKIMRLAVHIQNVCGVKDWQTATEDQLKLRDEIHSNIALLAKATGNNKQAIEQGVGFAVENQLENEF